MENKYRSYVTVMPCVLRADQQKKSITIHPRQEHVRKVFDKIGQIRVMRIGGPVHEFLDWMQNSEPVDFSRSENGDLTLYTETPVEGAYSICLGNIDKYGVFTEQAAFKVYALRDDLFRLKPFKGDFHMHSNGSDGQESPAYMAATNRKAGFDFMALTDHDWYEPSLAARDAMADFGCDMLVCPGEEVHLPNNEVHIVNFGGSSSVNQMVRDNREQYFAGVKEYEKSVPENYDPDTRFQVAASEWTFDRIRETGGLSVFCHPYWFYRHHNHIGEDVIELLMERTKFDAVEVVGGCRIYTDWNMLCMARWQEFLANGKRIPVVGVSDSHCGDNGMTGWYYTVVFAEKLTFESIAEAIRDNRSVAVHWIPNTYPTVVGSYRLVRFTFFLLREFYPWHDELCRIEGEIIRRGLAGEEDAAAQLAARKGAVPRFIEQCWEQISPKPADCNVSGQE